MTDDIKVSKIHTHHRSMAHHMGDGHIAYLIYLLAQGQYFLNLHMPPFSTDALKINFKPKDLTLSFNALQSS